MGTIEMFDHTADVGLRVEADSLDDLFRTAAEGLFDYVVINRDQVRDEETLDIQLQADSPTYLLLDWLRELLFLFETRHCLLGRFEVQVAPDGRSLQARASGEPTDPDRHILDHEIKAVTDHEARVFESNGRWHAELILDI